MMMMMIDDEDDDDMKSFWVLGLPAPFYFYRSIHTYTLRKTMPICQSREPDIFWMCNAILTIKINN